MPLSLRSKMATPPDIFRPSGLLFWCSSFFFLAPVLSAPVQCFSQCTDRGQTRVNCGAFFVRLCFVRSVPVLFAMARQRSKQCRRFFIVSTALFCAVDAKKKPCEFARPFFFLLRWNCPHRNTRVSGIFIQRMAVCTNLAVRNECYNCIHSIVCSTLRCSITCRRHSKS